MREVTSTGLRLGAWRLGTVTGARDTGHWDIKNGLPFLIGDDEWKRMGTVRRDLRQCENGDFRRNRGKGEWKGEWKGGYQISGSLRM